MVHDAYLTNPHLLVGHTNDVSIRADISSLLTQHAYSLLGTTAADVRDLRGARRDRVTRGFLLMRLHLSTRYEVRSEQRKWAVHAHSGKLPGSRSESTKCASTWNEIGEVVYVNEGKVGVSHQAAHKRFAR